MDLPQEVCLSETTGPQDFTDQWHVSGNQHLIIYKGAISIVFLIPDLHITSTRQPELVVKHCIYVHNSE